MLCVCITQVLRLDATLLCHACWAAQGHECGQGHALQGRRWRHAELQAGPPLQLKHRRVPAAVIKHFGVECYAATLPLHGWMYRSRLYIRLLSAHFSYRVGLVLDPPVLQASHCYSHPQTALVTLQLELLSSATCRKMLVSIIVGGSSNTCKCLSHFTDPRTEWPGVAAAAVI